MDLVIGCYLYPRVLIAEPDWSEPLGHLRVGAVIETDGLKLLVTLSGGIFVRPPPELVQTDPDASDEPTLWRQIDFEVTAARAANNVICELALNGVVSEPAAPAFICQGRVVDNHIAIRSVGGGREAYVDRSIDHLADQSTWHALRLWPNALAESRSLARTSRLLELSSHAPTLVAGAYSAMSRMQYVEAIADAWIIVEQYLRYAMKRAGLGRTGKASQAIRRLTEAGILSSELSAAIGDARKARNDLLHGADLSAPKARTVLNAMKLMLEAHCGSPVSTPLETESTNW